MNYSETMKKLFICLVLLVSALSGFAQTAEEVINKYVVAMGGMDKLRSMQSLYMEEVAVAPNGMEITTKTYKAQGQLYRVERDFGMGSMTTLVTDKGGWMASPRSQGAFEAMPEEMLATLRTELDCTLPLVNFAEKGHAVELTGTEDVNGVSCYVIKLTNKTGRSTTFYIDSKNWLVIRSSTKGGRMMFGGGGFGGGGGRGGGREGGNPPNNEERDIITDYSDYQKTSDGYLFPMTTTRSGMGGRGMSSSVEKIEVNVRIDAKLFQPE